jgi:hypothetical protein
VDPTRLNRPSLGWREAVRDGGVTPSRGESGERFHPLRGLHQGGVDHQQSPFAAGSASLELRELSEAPLGKTVEPGNGLQGHRMATKRPS